MPSEITKLVASLLVVSMCPLASQRVASAQDGNTAIADRRSDDAALGRIFAEQHVLESGIGVLRHAESLDANARYALLRTWVLPGTTHRAFRLTTDFVSPSGLERAATAESDGGKLVSPALRLTQLARLTGQTGALRKSVLACDAVTAAEQVNQKALLTLIAMEEENTEQAFQSFEQLLKLVTADRALLDQTRQGILLCAERASQSREMSEWMREPINLIMQHYRTEYQRDAWLRHLWAVSAKLIRQTSDQSAESATPSYRSSQWHPSSLETAFEHGSAFPHPTWQFTPGSVRSLSSYADDFLFFTSPLRGDFSLDGDATGFGYREAQFVNAGYWLGLVYNHEQYAIGDFRGELQRHPLASPLTRTNDTGFIHTHVRNRDGRATTSLNGAPIQTRNLNSDPYPWVAIRSNYRVHGGVDNLTISGAPTIPDSISMVESPSLLGWYDYYQAPGNQPNRLSDWKATLHRTPDGEEHWEISDPRSDRYHWNNHVEHLLRYMRPMMEDGTIEYEFWYSPGESIAHPALGRTCFLLNPTGVRLHRLTDGRFERTSLRPDNVSEAEGSFAPVSLKPDSWNRTRLLRKGNTLSLAINGQIVLEHQIPGDEPAPKFGLFHYANLSELRVRNPIWTGDWPKTLPSPEQQELAGDVHRRLAWSAPQLPKTYVHSFDKNSLLSGQISVVQGDPAEMVATTDDGMIVRQTSETGYRGTLIAPAIDVGGDFDVIIDFDQFACDSLKEKIGSVRMHVTAKTATEDLALVQRVQDRNNDHMIQCLRMNTLQGTQRRHYFGRQPLDATAGRMRLSRRGDQIYYLVADEHSDQFRLLGQESFADEDLEQLGIHIGVQIQGPKGSVGVRFKRLEVRAERLSGIATIDPESLLVDLRNHREQLPVLYQHDFITTPPDDRAMYRWANDLPWQAADGGLKIEARGSDDWTSAGISIRQRFEGDFDVRFDFGESDLAVPEQGKHSQIYLQIELANQDATQLCSLLTKSADGSVVCQSQVRTRSDSGFQYQTMGNQPAEDPDYLRVQRRGNTVYFVAGNNDLPRERFLGMFEASDDPIDFFGTRVMLHTGGAQRTSQILAKTLTIRSERSRSLAAPQIRTITPTQPAVPRSAVPQPAVPRSPMPQPSLPSRILNSLRGLLE